MKANEAAVISDTATQTMIFSSHGYIGVIGVRFPGLPVIWAVFIRAAFCAYDSKRREAPFDRIETMGERRDTGIRGFPNTFPSDSPEIYF